MPYVMLLVAISTASAKHLVGGIFSSVVKAKPTMTTIQPATIFKVIQTEPSGSECWRMSLKKLFLFFKILKLLKTDFNIVLFTQQNLSNPMKDLKITCVLRYTV